MINKMIKKYNEYIVLINESYKFAYNCVIAKNLKELDFIIDNMKEISADTFLKYVSLNNVNRHLRDNIKYKTIDDLKKDWTVSFYKIKKNDIDAYVFRNSAIEYVFKNTTKTKTKEKIDANDENEDWNTKKNYRVLKTYKGIKVGTILPVSKRKIKTIIQHKNGKTQFEIEEYWFNADNIIKYEYNDEINEKLSDKLSGFDEKTIKQQFLNGEISVSKYLEICKKYNLKKPSKEEIKQALKELLYNGKILTYPFYVAFLNNFCNEEPTEKDMKKFFLDGKIDLKLYLELCNKYNYNLPTYEELHNSNIDYKSDKSSIYLAMKYSSLPIFKYLIEQLDLNKTSYIKQYILLDLIYNNENKFAFYLFNNIDNLDYIDLCFEKAIKGKNIEFLKYLLEKGFKIKNYMINKTNNETIKELLQKYYDKQNDI